MTISEAIKILETRLINKPSDDSSEFRCALDTAIDVMKESKRQKEIKESKYSFTD